MQSSMAALLRGHPAICRIFAAFGRSNIKETLNYVKSVKSVSSRTHLNHNLTRNYATNIPTRPGGFMPTGSQRPTLASLPKNIDDALNMIDREIRRVGRVRKDIVMETYERMQKLGQVSGHQSLLMLRCFGSAMVDESPAMRDKLADQLWTGLRALGAKYDVTHYNAMLRVHLQNEKQFVPSEFLGTMEAEGIKPNRVTYQRLIAGYCQSGDIKGASQILEHMKNANLPINEMVFNTLITGHMRAGDAASATGILKIMRDSGIPPSPESYSTLMVEYARKGEIENIEKTSAEASEAQMVFHASHFFDVVQSLCNSGYSQHVDKVLALCPTSDTFGYNQDCMNAILQLVCCSHDDVAHKLFLTMQHPKTFNPAEATFGRFLLKAMIKHERPLETVVSTLKDLSARGLNSDKVDFIAQWALVYQKPDYALKAFEIIAAEGLPIRTHYFWPIFISNKKQKNAEGIYAATEQMEKLVSRSHDFIHTLHDHVIPSLVEAGESFDTVTQRLQEMGILEGDVNFASMLHMLKRGQVQEALDYAKQNTVRIHHAVLRPHLMAVYLSARNPEPVVELLSLALANPVVTPSFRVTDLPTSFLFSLVENKQNRDIVGKVLNMFLEKKIGISRDDDLKTKLEEAGVPLETLEQLMALDVSPPSERNTRRDMTEMTGMAAKSIEELEGLITEFRSKNINVKGPMRWLLAKYCHEGDVAKAEALKTELDDLGFIYTPDLLRSLMHMASLHKKDITDALKYKEMLESQYSEFNAYATEVINLAALYAENGKTNEAIDVLKTYHSNHTSYMQNKDYANSYMNEAECLNVVVSAQVGGDKMAPLTLMNVLFECGYIKNNCYKLLETYVRGFAEKNDIDGAVEALSHCINQYKRVPLFDLVFRMLIEKEDPERLQKVMDMASSVVGEMHALHYLMFSFIQCGKESQAKRILETPGIRAIMDLMDNFGNTLINKGQIEELENLVSLTKGLFGLDREQMLFLLIKGHCRAEQFDKALNVFTMMEEENINPRGRTLRYLGKSLQSHGLEVPFEIPDVPFVATQDPPRPSPTIDADVASLLSAKEMEAISQAAKGEVEGLKELRQGVGGTFSTKFLTEMANALFRSRRKGSLKYFVSDLAMMGDVESLEHLREMNLQVLNQGLIHVSLSKAYLESGSPEIILEKMSNDRRNLNKYLSFYVVKTFHEKYPSLFTQFEDVVMRGAEDGNLSPLSFLWQFYFMEEKLDKATQLVQKYPDMLRDLRIATACNHAKSNNREDLLRYLIDANKGNISNKAFAYSYMVGLKCQQDDVQGALNVLEEVKGDGLSADDLRPFPLAMLESLLVANSQTVPWPVGKYGQVSKAAQSSSSSTSSDSESDVETAVKPSLNLG